MAAHDDVPLDDKAKRMRDLLSSFYSPDPSLSSSNSSKYLSLDAIDSTSFDADQYMNLLVHKSNLEALLQRHVEMAAEIKNLDTDLQTLVYENYNKFISATDTIKRMKNNIVGMEANMEQLLEKASVFLRGKEQFIYDLPARLGKCIKAETYADAVRFYIGAMPIFKAYGDSSFQDCKRASEEAMATIVKSLQGKLFSDSESIHARAEAAVLLKQLDFPVHSLKAKLFEKLEQSLDDLQLKTEEITNILKDSDPQRKENEHESVSTTSHDASVCEFAEAVRAYRVIFPDSEKQLIKLAQDLIAKHFEFTREYIKKRVSIADFQGVLRIIWRDVLLMDDVLNEASLPDYSYEASKVAVKEYVASTFSHLLLDISDALTNAHIKQKEGVEEHPLQAALEAGKKAVLQGSMDVLLSFRQLLDDELGLLVKLRDLIIGWVQEGFQKFFRALDDHFLLLSGRHKSTRQNQSSPEGTQVEKVVAGLVLVTCSNFQEIAASFSAVLQGYESGPAFVPGELCRIFRSDGEKLLQHLQVIGTEVKQILPQGARKHRRSESNGSTTSSRSNPLRDDRINRSNTQRARSQLLETHLAKLFKQKVEIFTKIEYTQESVVSTILKLCLKSLQEFVRLQTFNRSGFQQIQLDIQFLRGHLKEIAEDEASVDFLLDEVVVGASERCLDPIPLEPPILDKLIQAKLAKRVEHTPIPT
ncbi:hypothetical protein Tsubulata_037506 [Turnera subulata]|uniref:Vacuolar protein sorting-associated protein 51 homolog n=1 Tax=Turnera subulata TaxID=218843 RepID=A0A9Q0G4G5_9ROSI|nr:hypothetical protein Tsubulata_037506 [Turnera subulata]